MTAHADRIAADTTVLTVNNRLARAIAAGHATAMRAAGQRAWETPVVMPWMSYVAREWQRLRERDSRSARALPQALDAAQSLVLWQRVVRDADSHTLLSVAGAAGSAAAARELLMRHEVALTAAHCVDNVDAKAFRRWHARFETLLADGHWIDAAALPGALATHIVEHRKVDADAGQWPGCLRFSGFEQFTAQQQRLLDAWQSVGVRIEIDDVGDAPASVERVTFSSPQDELQAMARWARAALDDGEHGSIGIVLPDLESRLDAVEACFEDRLHPCAQVAMTPQLAARAFNISLGRSLAQCAVVDSALSALQLLLPSVDAQTVGTVCLSEYLEEANVEYAQRLALDLRLRDTGVRTIGTRRLARVARAEKASSLSQRIVDVIELSPHERSRHSLIEHAERFVQALSIVGWPHGRVLGSIEFQAVEALRAQFEVLASMANVSEPCTTSSALSLLRRLVSDTLFQPRTANAPVQIMGVLEAAGMKFARLWLGAMDDRQWPPQQTPNALLPIGLQREHDMPGASPERSLARAQGILSRLLCAAPQIVVSHAQADGDMPLRVSPDIFAIREVACPSLALSPFPLPDEAIADNAPALERLADWQVSALAPNWRARGGSRVLTDQAACPFRAFAANRLSAKGVARASAPLDASARGNLAHRTMQELFSDITSLSALLALDEQGVRSACNKAAKEAVSAMLRRHPGELPAALIDAERARMATLAAQWLEVESQRAPFLVETVEQRRTVRIGGLSLSIQIDRVDKVDGRRLLIDYKTGKPSRSGWFGERPDEPQLPLYALALETDGHRDGAVAALCFARLRRAQQAFDGISEDDSWAPGLKALGSSAGAAGPHKEFADMRQLKEHWSRVLTGLAAEFADGQARVDPKPGACRYCETRALCRVDALGRLGDEDAAETDPEFLA